MAKQSPLHVQFLGQLPYLQAWERQKELRKARIAGEIDDQLLLLEHPATITLGRLRGEESLRLSTDALEAKGVEVIRSNRGGDATLHAPGQLVGYLIVNITERGLKLLEFVERLAGVFVRWLDGYGIEARYEHEFPGVWVGEEKIVAFGFHLEQGVTMHGFALNLHTDLSLFDLIIPCGLQGKGVASLAGLLPEDAEAPSLASAAEVLGAEIARCLS